LVPTALALKIFSTAVRPWSLCEIFLEAANADFNSISKVLHAKLCSFLPKTIA
jgi:hypothetical protein